MYEFHDFTNSNFNLRKKLDTAYNLSYQNNIKTEVIIFFGNIDTHEIKKIHIFIQRGIHMQILLQYNLKCEKYTTLYRNIQNTS